MLGEGHRNERDTVRQQILNTYAMTLDTAKRLCEGVECARCAELPFADAKHPAWTLSHLSIASGMAASFLDLDADEGPIGGVPEAWMAVSAPGVAITDDRAKYAPLDALIAELERVHRLVAERFERVSDEHLASPFPNEHYRAFWPTVADGAIYMMAHHEGYHLGQMSQWRRAAGYPSNNPF
ncbi:MAG: hypothetical protein Tsb0013_00770 [Phycisphaerales bacterium]